MSAPSPGTVDVLVAVARVETKVDAFHTVTADHESRLRVLESARWPARTIGTLGVVVAIATSVGAVWLR